MAYCDFVACCPGLACERTDGDRDGGIYTSEAVPIREMIARCQSRACELRTAVCNFV